MLFYRKRLKKSTPEDEAKLKQAMEENNVGFKDGMAMILSAFLVLVLPCLLILVGISILAMLIFGVL